MRVILNPDKNIVIEIKNKLKETKGYCPCSIIHNNDDYKCMCRAFREQETEGFCHCGLYQKIETE